MPNMGGDPSSEPSIIKLTKKLQPNQLKIDNLIGGKHQQQQQQQQKQQQQQPKSSAQNILNRCLAGINWNSANVLGLQNSSKPTTAVANKSQKINENLQKSTTNNFSFTEQNGIENLAISGDNPQQKSKSKLKPLNDHSSDLRKEDHVIDVEMTEIAVALKSNNNIELKKKNEKRKKKKKSSRRPGSLTKSLAIDCEMVGVGHMGEDHMLARVSIVNQMGDIILDKFVSPREKVIDYRTAVSGIRPKDIENGEDFYNVQKEVADIIKDRILIGHAISNDLKVLLLTHPKTLIRDTSKYRPLTRFVRRHATPSLKTLAKIILDMEIQTGEHNSVEDARTVMNIYLQFAEEWEKYAQRHYHNHRHN